MPGIPALIQHNRAFASEFSKGDLPFLPRLSTLVVTCLDARVDPAHVLGLELGDAFVIRNVGGRITDEVIEQIAILGALVGGAGGGALEVAVVHHTDCGTVRFADPEIRKELVKVAGTGESPIQKLAAANPEESVADDLDRLRAAPILPDDLVVAGYVYDLKGGQLKEIAAPRSLRGAR